MLDVELEAPRAFDAVEEFDRLLKLGLHPGLRSETRARGEGRGMRGEG